MRGNQKRRRTVGRYLRKKIRMEVLMQLRWKERMPPIMERTEWRWLRRKNPVRRVALAGGPEVETGVAPGPVTDAGPGPGRGRDPSVPGLGRDGADLAAEIGGKAEVALEGPDLGITEVRRARETAGPRRGKTRSLSREIMIKRKPETRIRRTRSTKLSTWRYRILLKCVLSERDYDQEEAGYENKKDEKHEAV